MNELKEFFETVGNWTPSGHTHDNCARPTEVLTVNINRDQHNVLERCKYCEVTFSHEDEFHLVEEKIGDTYKCFLNGGHTVKVENIRFIANKFETMGAIVIPCEVCGTHCDFHESGTWIVPDFY